MFKTNLVRWLLFSALRLIVGLLALFSFFFLPPVVFWISGVLWCYLTFRFYVAMYKLLLVFEEWSPDV